MPRKISNNKRKATDCTEDITQKKLDIKYVPDNNINEATDIRKNNNTV